MILFLIMCIYILSFTVQLNVIKGKSLSNQLGRNKRLNSWRKFIYCWKTFDNLIEFLYLVFICILMFFNFLVLMQYLFKLLSRKGRQNQCYSSWKIKWGIRRHRRSLSNCIQNRFRYHPCSFHFFSIPSS